MSMQSVIETARADLGYTEFPVNITKYWDDYDPKMQGQPWCVAALWAWFNWAGERMAFFGGGKTARCSVLLEWYEKQGMTVDKKDIQIGDIVILNFSGKKVDGHLDTEHCGLVVDKGKLAGTWYTVEGNTTPGEEGTPREEYNGGCVALKMRSIKNIVGICRPQYQPEPEIVDDITGHWAQENWRWAEEIGLVHGYPDGSRKPDQNATRAEIITMLKRYDDYRFGGSKR